MHLSFHLILLITSLHMHHQLLAYSNLVVSEPLKPPDFTTTVPSFPVQTGTSQTCKLDLSSELFGGVNAACGGGTGHNNDKNKNLDRNRCCPVLAAWLYAAHAKTALKLKNITTSNDSGSNEVMPMMPDDSQKCVNSLQSSLLTRNIHIPQPNATCDAVICFCGIRLHQIGSLSCPVAFNTTRSAANVTVTPTGVVKNLEKSCRNSSYSGCTRCLGALQKLNGSSGKNGTKKSDSSSRTSKMMNRDCQLMGLTWLLERNKTAYIATVSAVLRAIMYHESSSKCSPDHENMPLAVDSLQFDKTDQSNSSSSFLEFSFLSSCVVVFVVLVMTIVGFV